MKYIFFEVPIIIMQIWLWSPLMTIFFSNNSEIS